MTTATTFQVTVQPFGKTFEVKLEETILSAAIRQGIKLPHSCRNGTCRACICVVMEGEVVQEEIEESLISTKELKANRRLICTSVVKSDAVLEKVSPRQARD